MYWEPSIEALPRAELEALQLQRLRTTIDQCLKTPFYRDVLGTSGITASGIKHIEDVQALPFTTKEEL